MRAEISHMTGIGNEAQDGEILKIFKIKIEFLKLWKNQAVLKTLGTTRYGTLTNNCRTGPR